jgi:hypothetical protein
MKKHLKFIALLGCILLMVGLVTLGADAMISFIVGGGTIILASPALVGTGVGESGLATGELYDTNSITQEDLNKIVIKVRPSDTPLDTLTREINNVSQAKNRETGGFEVGTRDVEDAVTFAFAGGADVANLRVGKKAIWQVSDTIYLPEIAGGDGKPLQLYVAAKDNAASTLQVVACNPVDGNIPAIANASLLMRLSKAMGEVDAQTDPFTTLPTDRKNYTQIHMTQVEVSTLSEIYNKRVALDFTTHKEISIWDWKRAMELTNLFGKKGKFVDPVANKTIYTSDGLWNQLTGVSEYASTATNAAFVKMTKEIFDGNNGSERRILLAGSELIEWLSTVENYSKQQRPEGVEIVHGVRFNKIITNFGELLVKPMSSLFLGDMAACGMVLDMSYIRKDVQEALQVTELDLDKTGQRRVKAVRMLENYCLFAENLPVHRKIIPA